MPSARCTARVCPPIHLPCTPPVPVHVPASSSPLNANACRAVDSAPAARVTCLLHLMQAKSLGECPPCHDGPNDEMDGFPKPPLPAAVPIAPVQSRPSPRLLCTDCSSELPVPEEEHLQKVNLCLEAAAPKKTQHENRSCGTAMGWDGSCWHGCSIPWAGAGWPLGCPVAHEEPGRHRPTNLSCLRVWWEPAPLCLPPSEGQRKGSS